MNEPCWSVNRVELSIPVMKNEPQPNPAEMHLPEGLQAKLEEFRSRLWAVKIAEGALAAIVGLAISYLVVFGLDRAFDTPGWLRALILIAGAAVLGLGLPLRWHKWVWKQRSLESVSKLLKLKFPRLGDQLLGIVELAKRGDETAHSKTLVRAAMAQVDEKVRDQDFSNAVPDNHHRAWMVGAFAALGVAMLTVFFVSDAARNALSRWMMPWKDTDRYTFAKVQELPDKMVVPYAEPFDVAAQMKNDTEWNPETGKLHVPGGELPLEASNVEGKFEFNSPPLKEDGAMKVRIGDVREDIEVLPMTRPELEGLLAIIQLPDYLRYDHDPEIEVRGGSVSVVKGGKATIKGTANRDLKRVEVDGSRTMAEKNWFQTIAAEVTESQTRLLDWEDIHGLTPKEPLKLRINAVDDTAPDVVAKKLTREQVVLEDEVVNFDISAGDDFGVKKVGLEWVGLKDAIHNPDPSSGDKLVSAGDPQKRDVAVQGTFSAKREGVKPQTLQVRAFAEDYKPERARSYSPAFVIHVMNPDDHAKWLTDEFGKWFSNAREVYEKEQQLYSTNKELRKMDAGELDRPENRRKVEKQANAEASNGRRLESLTGSGTELVKQATKNKEFDAQRLGTWAKMLESLDDISKNRMPSVSELLKQTANAAGKEGGKPGKPGEASQQAQNGKGEKPPEGQASSGEPGKPGEKPGEPSKSKSSNKSGPMVGKAGEGGKPKKAAEEEPSKEKIPAVPTIAENEKGFMPEVKPDPNAPEDPKKKPRKGKLTLPQTVLQGVASKKKDEEAGEAESPAQEKMDEAITEQEGLLAEFAKVADELQELLASLEASTFVKRLKAASREQMEIATDLNTTLNGGFGMSKDRIAQDLRETGENVSEREEAESKNVYIIQTDLAAYFQRKQDVRYKKILDGMRDTEIVTELKDIGATVKVNLNGRSIVAAEFWADSLDRWAEELVSAAKGKT